MHGHDRAQPRHPRRTDHLRPQARRALGRIRAQPRPSRHRPQGDRDLRHLGLDGHLRQYRPGGRGACRGQARPDARAGIDPGDPARPARRVFYGAGPDRGGNRASRDRDPPPSAHRTARGRGVFLPRAEGFLGDAAQAQPGIVGEPDRPRPSGALARRAGPGKRHAVARARHLALVGRAGDRPRRDDSARFCAGAARRAGRAAGRLPQPDAGQSSNRSAGSPIPSACCWH